MGRKIQVGILLRGYGSRTSCRTKIVWIDYSSFMEWSKSLYLVHSLQELLKSSRATVLGATSTSLILLHGIADEDSIRASMLTTKPMSRESNCFS
jgi:hypothetical protein